MGHLSKQNYVLDYNEMRQWLKMTTDQTPIAVVTTKSWSICQMNVKNSFLYGHYKENVYMRPLERIVGSKSSVCHLQLITLWSSIGPLHLVQEI